MRVSDRVYRTVSVLVFFIAPFLLSEPVLLGQDERLVSSPDGKIVFHLFVAPQKDYALSRLAYQVDFRGKPVIQTSYIGVDLWDQEPILGENDGLTSYTSSSTPDYRAAKAGYMQNGSLGRTIEVEVRAYNDGVAFRYTIGRSAGVLDLLIADEATEFAFPPASTPENASFVVDEGERGWVEITEKPKANFPRMQLAWSEAGTFLTRLERKPDDPKLAFAGHTPYTLPWRVIVIGPDRKCILSSRLVSKLSE